MPNIAITRHAVDRYVERVNNQMSWTEAHRYLKAAASKARKLPERTFNGQLQYLADDIVFVVKHDPQDGLVAVTVGRYEALDVNVVENAAKVRETIRSLTEYVFKQERLERRYATALASYTERLQDDTDPVKVRDLNQRISQTSENLATLRLTIETKRQRLQFLRNQLLDLEDQLPR